MSTDEKTKEFIDLQVESIAMEHSEVTLLRGEWPVAMVEQMAKHLSERNIQTLLVVLPDGKMDFKTMSIDQFYGLMKACEKQMGLTRTDVKSDTDGVCGD